MAPCIQGVLRAIWQLEHSFLDCMSQALRNDEQNPYISKSACWFKRKAVSTLCVIVSRSKLRKDLAGHL